MRELLNLVLLVYIVPVITGDKLMETPSKDFKIMEVMSKPSRKAFRKVENSSMFFIKMDSPPSIQYAAPTPKFIPVKKLNPKQFRKEKYKPSKYNPPIYISKKYDSPKFAPRKYEAPPVDFTKYAVPKNTKSIDTGYKAPKLNVGYQAPKLNFGYQAPKLDLTKYSVPKKSPVTRIELASYKPENPTQWNPTEKDVPPPPKKYQARKFDSPSENFNNIQNTPIIRLPLKYKSNGSPNSLYHSNVAYRKGRPVDDTIITYIKKHVKEGRVTEPTQLTRKSAQLNLPYKISYNKKVPYNFWKKWAYYNGTPDILYTIKNNRKSKPIFIKKDYFR